MIDPTRHRQLEELNMVELCTRIFRNARNELYLNMRYLDLSLSSLGFEQTRAAVVWGQDGFVDLLSSDYVCDLYQRGRVHVNRAYLHMVLHCLFCIWTRAANGNRNFGTWPAILRWNPCWTTCM